MHIYELHEMSVYRCLNGSWGLDDIGSGWYDITKPWLPKNHSEPSKGISMDWRARLI